METQGKINIQELTEGEFFLPYYNDETLKNELAPLLEIKSGLVVIGGTVGTGRTKLLQNFVKIKKAEGLKVLVIAHEHNEIQGVDSFYFEKTNWIKSAIAQENVDTMLARIEAANPDVIVFDDMDYSEILAMANTLASNGKLVLAATFHSAFFHDKTLAERFEIISDIEGKDFKAQQEELITGHVSLRLSGIRTEKVNIETRIIAQVIKP